VRLTRQMDQPRQGHVADLDGHRLAVDRSPPDFALVLKALGQHGGVGLASQPAQRHHAVNPRVRRQLLLSHRAQRQRQTLFQVVLHRQPQLGIQRVDARGTDDPAAEQFAGGGLVRALGQGLGKFRALGDCGQARMVDQPLRQVQLGIRTDEQQRGAGGQRRLLALRRIGNDHRRVDLADPQHQSVGGRFGARGRRDQQGRFLLEHLGEQLACRFVFADDPAVTFPAGQIVLLFCFVVGEEGLQPALEVGLQDVLQDPTASPPHFRISVFQPRLQGVARLQSHGGEVLRGALSRFIRVVAQFLHEGFRFCRGRLLGLRSWRVAENRPGEQQVSQPAEKHGTAPDHGGAPFRRMRAGKQMTREATVPVSLQYTRGCRPEQAQRSSGTRL